MTERRFEVLVFDWDGTLSDSLPSIIAALQAAIAETGLAARHDAELLGIIGLGLDEAFEQLYPGLGQGDRERLVAAYRRHYRAAASAASRLFPGAETVLRKLRHRGYLLAVATGKSRRGLDRSLADTGLEDCFHATRCADETFSKPHPQMLRDIMECLAVEPHNTLMIGDSRHDLQMAANAGVAAVAVTYGAQPAGGLLEFNPLTKINNLTELAAWLAAETPARTRA